MKPFFSLFLPLNNYEREVERGRKRERGRGKEGLYRRIVGYGKGRSKRRDNNFFLVSLNFFLVSDPFVIFFIHPNYYTFVFLLLIHSLVNCILYI